MTGRSTAQTDRAATAPYGAASDYRCASIDMEKSPTNDPLAVISLGINLDVSRI